MTTPLPERTAPLPFGVGRALSPLYALAVARRNARYNRGAGVTTPPIPVVSVGNLSVGGTGKTPMVRRVVEALKLAGRRPGVVLRGYGPKTAGMSDEEAEHRAALPGVPIRADPNRRRAIFDLVSRVQGARIDCVVLDDGFQHRAVARKVDIVLIDSTRDPWRDALLPGGWLREPVGSLARATAVVITHAESTSPSAVEEIAKRVRIINPDIPIAVTEHTWTELRIANDRVDAASQVNWLEGKRVLAVCAIARPRPFLSGIHDAGAETVAQVVLPDHAAYTARRVAHILATAQEHKVEAIVCTGKDWVKFRSEAGDHLPCPVVRPQLRHHYVSGGEELEKHIVEGVGERR